MEYARLPEPQLQAYLLLLLELGLGLRRHEADKAQWDWVMIDAQGQVYLEVRATPYFTPKGKERRVVPMDNAIHAVLLAQKANGAFIVPGNSPQSYPAGKAPKNLTYRCERHHRALAVWLRQRGNHRCQAVPPATQTVRQLRCQQLRVVPRSEVPRAQ